MTDASQNLRGGRSRASRAKALRRFVKRVLKEYRAGRCADSCMEEIDRRMRGETDQDTGRKRI